MMTCLYTRGLSAIIETQTFKSSRGSEMLHDLENYAELLDCMSEIQEVDTRVQKCVDEL